MDLGGRLCFSIARTQAILDSKVLEALRFSERACGILLGALVDPHFSLCDPFPLQRLSLLAARGAWLGISNRERSL